MAQSRDELPPSRIELVVLARLSQPRAPTDADLGEAVHQLALPRESAEAARRHALELLAGLVRRAWVTGDDVTPRRGKSSTSQAPRKLTESGKRVLRSAFNLSRVPTWAQVRDTHLASLALGVSPGSDLASKACTETALTAAVLCNRFGVRDAHTPMAVCDALIANALGMPAGKLTLDRIRAHVLTRGVEKLGGDAPTPGVTGYAPKLAAWIASSVVGANGTQRKMSRALARRWVCGEASPLGVRLAGTPANDAASTTAPAPAPATPPVRTSIAATPATTPPAAAPASPKSPAPTTPAAAPSTPAVAVVPARPPVQTPAFLDVVRDTIPRVGVEGRFGDKVYVSAIWRTIERDRKAGDLSLERFKTWLVAANRDGWLVLARADLIGAMDAKQVNESEINDRGATFHFVIDPRNGAARPSSQRESHAG